LSARQRKWYNKSVGKLVKSKGCGDAERKMAEKGEMLKTEFPCKIEGICVALTTMHTTT
jgi:hypothetical protein